MASHDLVELSADITTETLLALRTIFADPRLAHGYFHVCRVPRFEVPPSFLTDVDALVANRASRGAARTLADAGPIIARLVPAVGSAAALTGGKDAAPAMRAAALPS